MHKLASEFLELYKAGNSLQEIAALYNISRERIRQIISTHFDYNPRNRTSRMSLYYKKRAMKNFNPQHKGSLECIICKWKVYTPNVGEEFHICSKCRKLHLKVSKHINQ